MSEHTTEDTINRLKSLTEKLSLVQDRITIEHAVIEIQTAIAEAVELRAERDEARREVCGLLVACHTDPDDEKPDPNLKHVHAEIRGWDCFKENTNV